VSRGVILPAQRTDWNTPKWIVDNVLATFRAPIDLDPCSNPTSIVPATRRVELPEDGLAVPWEGNVYVNPPYGRGLEAWFKKAEEAPRQNAASVLMLVPAGTSNKAWQRYVKGSVDVSVCFLAGRVRFLGAVAGAAFSSAVILWTRRGDLHFRFADVWNKDGLVMQECESHGT
jgi:hypothetical protein